MEPVGLRTRTTSVRRPTRRPRAERLPFPCHVREIDYCADMSTIYDVAKLAGVSTATVSRVFSGAGVSAPKAEAVRIAAKELNFTPNRVARNLRRRESETIALIIPDVQNPYFTEMVRGVEDVASEAGYSVVLCNSDGRLDKEARYLQVSGWESMAGVIIAPASASTRLDEMIASNRPVVIVDRRTSHDTDLVVMDNRAAGAAATKELLAAGFTRIAHIAGPQDIDTALERVEGWRSALQESAPAADESLLRFSTFHVDGGRASMSALLDLPEPPDAIVAGNNLIGVGALQVLGERGLTPPEFGVAVIGSLPFSTIAPGAVTIVRLGAQEMGSVAARMLIERIAGDERPIQTVVLPHAIQRATAARD